MSRELIITMTAANRAGILSAVTKAMGELGADLREMSQTVVRGFFTMIFSAEFPENIDEGIIRDHLNDVCRPFDIEIGVKDPARDLSDSGNGTNSQIHALRIGGNNRPGVLRKLSSVLSIRRVDITGMHAVRTSDAAGFEMVMKVAVPTECGIEDLLKELQAAGEPFEATVELRDVPV
ncbi:MAG: ACT domain-containing protein [Planctomycetaceae bacterium]|nr:ACT domain-containing protein [Planctomycetaceae bacterium]